MRYVYLLLILLFVSSCAHNRLRLRKVDKHDRTEIVQNESKQKRDRELRQEQQVTHLYAVGYSEPRLANVIARDACPGPNGARDATDRGRAAFGPASHGIFSWP